MELASRALVPEASASSGAAHREVVHPPRAMEDLRPCVGTCEDHMIDVVAAADHAAALAADARPGVHALLGAPARREDVKRPGDAGERASA